jgi:hypothetical protein
MFKRSQTIGTMFIGVYPGICFHFLSMYPTNLAFIPHFGFRFGVTYTHGSLDFFFLFFIFLVEATSTVNIPSLNITAVNDLPHSKWGTSWAHTSDIVL